MPHVQLTPPLTSELLVEKTTEAVKQYLSSFGALTLEQTAIALAALNNRVEFSILKLERQRHAN